MRAMEEESAESVKRRPYANGYGRYIVQKIRFEEDAQGCQYAHCCSKDTQLGELLMFIHPS